VRGNLKFSNLVADSFHLLLDSGVEIISNGKKGFAIFGDIDLLKEFGENFFQLRVIRPGDFSFRFLFSDLWNLFHKISPIYVDEFGNKEDPLYVFSDGGLRDCAVSHDCGRHVIVFRKLLYDDFERNNSAYHSDKEELFLASSDAHSLFLPRVQFSKKLYDLSAGDSVSSYLSFAEFGFSREFLSTGLFYFRKKGSSETISSEDFDRKDSSGDVVPFCTVGMLCNFAKNSNRNFETSRFVVNFANSFDLQLMPSVSVVSTKSYNAFDCCVAANRRTKERETVDCETFCNFELFGQSTVTVRGRGRGLLTDDLSFSTFYKAVGSNFGFDPAYSFGFARAASVAGYRQKIEPSFCLGMKLDLSFVGNEDKNLFDCNCCAGSDFYAVNKFEVELSLHNSQSLPLIDFFSIFSANFSSKKKTLVTDFRLLNAVGSFSVSVLNFLKKSESAIEFKYNKSFCEAALLRFSLLKISRKLARENSLLFDADFLIDLSFFYGREKSSSISLEILSTAYLPEKKFLPVMLNLSANYRGHCFTISAGGRVFVYDLGERKVTTNFTVGIKIDSLGLLSLNKSRRYLLKRFIFDRAKNSSV
jgi:hypothetical protein